MNKKITIIIGIIILALVIYFIATGSPSTDVLPYDGEDTFDGTGESTDAGGDQEVVDGGDQNQPTVDTDVSDLTEGLDELDLGGDDFSDLDKDLDAL